ncbi:methyltransferase family protein [Azospirillum brasilense]|uniref:Methyltransferase family protein n=1 Tax=Azospirillum brasilense TaxID=192 RepID=A0A560BWQ3_AZOBR|nr:class I SAM-dependent methyltransferase [Azospirillum brasilense]MBK3734743.1 methyltransferase domain-containing protein [Azospirillum brasilense]TWA77038.1 methyltransferase family protein [Azospirillum brasilense]
MSGWSDGYNADIAYTHGAYRELAPGYLSYVCLLNGIRPPRTDRPFRYCELGCGQGMTLNILAATHPQGRFTGIDFNPLHIAGARRLAEEAELTNVAFHERSFQQIVADGLPGDEAGAKGGEGFDFIALHGVYSWISPENRQAVVDILERMLKPGGLVYLSYNSQPGWAPLMPLQKLILAHATANPGRSDHQFDAALGFLNRLNEAGAGYFAVNSAAGQHLGMMAGQDRRYLSHEYLNAYWEPLGHAQVAKDLARAKLGYAGSATIPQNFDDLAVRAELRAILAEITDPTLAQTVRDFAVNQVFRRDVFVRGPESMPAAETEAALRRLRFTLLVPRESASLAIPVPLGELRHDPSLGLPILDALAAGTPSLGEIAAMPEMARHDFGTLSRFLALLVSSNQAHPLVDAPEEGRASAGRLNRAVARRMGLDESLFHLAAPVVGQGLGADSLERLVLAGLLTGPRDGQPLDIQALGGFVAGALEGFGRSVLAEDGSPVTGRDAMRERLAVVLPDLLNQKLPAWRRTGIL